MSEVCKCSIPGEAGHDAVNFLRSRRNREQQLSLDIFRWWPLPLFGMRLDRVTENNVGTLIVYGRRWGVLPELVDTKSVMTKVRQE